MQLGIVIIDGLVCSEVLLLLTVWCAVRFCGVPECSSTDPVAVCFITRAHTWHVHRKETGLSSEFSTFRVKSMDISAYASCTGF